MFSPHVNWKELLLLGLISMLSMKLDAEEFSGKVLWAIGKADNSAAEFALAPNGYSDFLKRDFGWEDKFYLVGRSSPASDFPYVLPGPEDQWAGSIGIAGWRTQVINILFDVENAGRSGEWKLIIDLVDAHSIIPPLFKVTVNKRPYIFQLSKGSGDESISGAWHKGKQQILTLDLKADQILQGGNCIELATIQGSWLIFDQVRLEGPGNATLTPPTSIFIRHVQPADYELASFGSMQSGHCQPLLVDIECLKPDSNLEVKLDGQTIFSASPETGRTVLEVPMPSVKQSVKSDYHIRVDGRILRSGAVMRSPHPLITPADYVDTLIGSAHSRWMIAPGPWAPFSMVKLSPDNQNSGWQAGYDPHIENIAGFSHIHEWTMAGLLLMPTVGPLQVQAGDQYRPDDGYRSRIDKTREVGQIGYYRVYLSDYDIDVELTATSRAGFHRYTYPAQKTPRVLLDFQIPAEYEYELQQVEVVKASSSRIEGFLKQFSPDVWEGIGQEYIVHFVVEFDQPIKTFGAWTDQAIQHNVSELKTGKVKDAGVFVEFATTQKQVIQVRTGISFVSIENAKLNLKQEITDPFGWDFQAVRQAQKNIWNDILERIHIETQDRREKVRFYTNLYRSFCRNTFSDVDGKWRDPEENVRQLKNPDTVMLGCDAFWNTFWNLNQLWNLITPEWSGRWVRSQLEMYDACGWLAKGPAGLEYIPVMVAEHEIPLIVGAYQMGIRDFNADKALTAMIKMQTTPACSVGGGLVGNRDLAAWLEFHYVPADKGRTSNTLEYAFDDWTVAQFAKARGNNTVYEQFYERSGWWKNIFDIKTKYARMKNSDGTWVTPFDPFKSGANQQYVEGNAWQLTFFVPQDVPGLIDIMGRDIFVKRLNSGFKQSTGIRFNAPNEQYWAYPVTHGNQQSMHFAYLFNWAGAPWLTQKWTREVMQRYYGYGIGNAYLGDEDQGQMSAWFIMAAMGLFQTDGGCRADPIYEIASPLYEKVVIDLGSRYGRGKTFSIIAKGTSRTNQYIQSATLNGQPLDRWFFSASELLKGGQLVLEMGSQPNMQWGRNGDKSDLTPEGSKK